MAGFAHRWRSMRGRESIEIDLFVLIHVFDTDRPETVELETEDNQIFTGEKYRRVRLHFEMNHGNETNDQEWQILHENGDEYRGKFAARQSLTRRLNSFGQTTFLLFEIHADFLRLTVGF